MTRWETPPRPPSNRNGGRFQIGMGGRFQTGIPGRLHRNPQSGRGAASSGRNAGSEAFARNHRLPIEWAEKGVRKEDHVLPWQRRMARDDAYGVYFIFKSMEQGPSFRVSAPKYATKDPNYRILARQRSRFTHYYFYLRDETLGPMVMRVAS